jgi:hypothetical protein
MARHMDEYIIVDGYSLSNIYKFVNERIKEGYIPIGGITCNIYTSLDNGIPKNFLQAMVKKHV